MKKRNQFIRILLAFSIILTLAFVTSMPLIAQNKHDHKASLRSITAYALAAQFGVTDDEGRLLVWKGPIIGDIDGYELWWFGEAPPMEETEDFRVSHYVARWEIFDEDPLPPDPNDPTKLITNPSAKLLLAGYSAGETVIPLSSPGLDGIWDGRGKVKEACKKYKHLKGRLIYEGGPVIFEPFNYHGTGITRIEGKRIHHNFAHDDVHDNTVAESAKGINNPEDFELFHNFPNPFNPSTTIEFNLPKTADVRIDIYNTAGQKVKTLLNSQMQAGSHQVKWDASGMASGVYYYKIQSGEIQGVKRMILLK
jgi:methionine-rich copper-binding protein CopC